MRRPPWKSLLITLRTFIITLTLFGLCSPHAWAQEGGVEQEEQGALCEEQVALSSPAEHWRALSFDLRGAPPSLEELEQVTALGEVPTSMIDQLLSEDGFAQRFARLHRALLWPYLGNSDTTPGYRLSYDAPWDANSGQTSLWYFPRPNVRGDARPCRDEPEPTPLNPTLVSDGPNTQREGYVCVRRYLDHSFGASHPACPEGQVKVCALDALPNLVSPVTGDRCDVMHNRYASPPEGCGCGPNLRWCGDYKQFERPLLDGFDQQLRWVIDNDRPYYELLAEAPPMLNGPLAHYYKYMAPLMGLSLPLSPSLIPALEYRDSETWVEIDAGPEARGALTNWVFLSRFLTQRARVDRFYQSFLCSPFQPPVSGIDSNGADRDEPDLQKREGCKYCHSIMEPVGAYWGRYTEKGASYLDPGSFPDFDPSCHRCASSGVCSQRCRSHYIVTAPTGAELPYLGYLKAYLFRRPEHQTHLNEGPRALVRRALLDGKLGRCTAKNAFKWLIGRPPMPDEAPWLEEVAVEFMSGGYDFKQLTRRLVTSELYRRVK